MVDEGTVCVCPQCGKKYKLKAGFEAASFSCKSCAATVWVAGKPPAPKVEAGGRRRAGGRRGRGRGRATAGRPAAGRRGRRAEADEGGEERRGGYERPKSNANLYIAIGGLAIIGIVVVVVIMTGKDAPPPAPPVAQTPSKTADPSTAPAKTTPAKPVAVVPEKPAVAQPEVERPDPKPAIAKTALAEGDNEENPAAPRSGKNLGGATKKKDRPRGTSRWDAPATLGHLKSTSPSERKQIDDLVRLMMDPQAGRDSLDAKTKLAALGKPAFPVILGAMAKVRDTIGDTDTIDERLIESSLKLADECLREMDGYLVSKSKPPIRPGTDKKYIVYIIRLHYRRWKEALEAMAEMPGPYDPSVEYEEEEK